MLLDKGEKTRNNFFRILRAIWLHPGISRSDLTKKLSYNKASMSMMTSSMLEEGVIYIPESQEKSGKVGRNPNQLYINEELGYSIGYDIQPAHISLTAVDIYCRKIMSRHYQVDTHKDHLDTVFFEVLQKFRAEDPIKDKFLLGIGVGITGIVDVHTQTILRSLPLGVVSDSYNFYEHISQKTDIPILLGNDANCFAASILARYRMDEHKNFICIFITYKPEVKDQKSAMRLGVGVGIVMNQNLYLGENGCAGEFRSLHNISRNDSQFSLSQDEVNQLSTDPAVLESFIDELVENMTIPINILNMNTIFVGGDLDFRQTEFTEKMRRKLSQAWPYDFERSLEIHTLEKDEDLVSYSAAGVFLQHLFSDPEKTDALDFKYQCWSHVLQKGM